MNERENRNVLRRFRKTARVEADVTSRGRLFQTRLPATGEVILTNLTQLLLRCVIGYFNFGHDPATPTGSGKAKFVYWGVKTWTKTADIHTHIALNDRIKVVVVSTLSAITLLAVLRHFLYSFCY